MRRAIWVTSLVVLATACSGESVAPRSVSPSGTSPFKTPLVSPPPSTSPSPSIEPVGVPVGTPPSFAQDVDAADLPADELVPDGTAPTDIWAATSPDGTQFALIAFAAPSDDPFRQARGLVVWRRFDDAPPWRAVFGLSDPADAGVLAVHALIGDATGDGSPDAITFEDTGGSGACGTWRVLDLAANTGVFTRKTCDTTIDLSPDPVGLVVREAVFEQGDAHCCPSFTKISILTFDEASGWTVYSSTEQPT
ncbi:MAG: hypothetical protein ACXWEG_00455 [Actinomycetota bacterium]